MSTGKEKLMSYRKPLDEEMGERRGRRLPLNCRVFFFGADEFEGEGQVVDISTGGCQISSPEPVRVGMLLRLSLFLPDHPWPMLVEEAIVRWINGELFGLEFTSIRLAQRERLRGLLMKHSRLNLPV